MAADNLSVQIRKAGAALNKRQVLIGIPSDATEKVPAGKSAPPLWVIGYMNENGDDELHIPPRPFLVPGVKSETKEITRLLRMAAQAALSGDMGRMDGLLDTVGEAGSGWFSFSGAVRCRRCRRRRFTPANTVRSRQGRGCR